MTFEPQPHTLLPTLENVALFLNHHYNNNPTAQRHHLMILPALNTAAYLMMAKKILITSYDHDDKVNIGFDYIASLNLRLPHTF